ncbi:MAG: N-acetylmuramoyl-L-alanine amidase [Saprospiraceae bacterium]
MTLSSKLFFSLLLIPFLSSAIDPPCNYLKVRPTKGLGVYGLLRAYQLLDKTENLEKFYEINKLKIGSPLQKDQSYYLPIRTIEFNGKSIRSSLKIEDYDKAKELQTYNEAFVEVGLKSQSYRKDKVLWVPDNFFNPANSKPNKRNDEDNQLVNRSPLPPSQKELIADSKIDKEEVEPEEVNAMINDKNSEVDPNNLIGKAKTISNKMLYVSLFGEKNCQVPVESDELSDQVFYIVPGHGGPDPGAIYKDKDTNFSFCEDEYAYDVSLRLARSLLTKGAIVYVIVQDKNDGIRDEKYLECDDDEQCIGGCSIPVSQKKRLRQGMFQTNQLYLQNKVNGIKQQWMISIHIDSQPEENRQDVFFYFQSESKESKKKAKQLKNIFTEKYKKYQNRDYEGTISARPLYVMRTSAADPIYIELANIRNSQDRERITSPRNRQLLADWIMEGFL